MSEKTELQKITNEETGAVIPVNLAFMTRKQIRFVDEYLLDFRPKEAAIRAGYKPRYARTIANDLLEKPLIKNYLAECELLAQERNRVTKDYFITKCKNIVEASDSKYGDKVNALTLLARITGFLKERSFESKQVVVLQQQGLHDTKPTEIRVLNQND